MTVRWTTITLLQSLRLQSRRKWQLRRMFSSATVMRVMSRIQSLRLPFLRLGQLQSKLSSQSPPSSNSHLHLSHPRHARKWTRARDTNGAMANGTRTPADLTSTMTRWATRCTIRARTMVTRTMVAMVRATHRTTLRSRTEAMRQEAASCHKEAIECPWPGLPRVL